MIPMLNLPLNYKQYVPIIVFILCVFGILLGITTIFILTNVGKNKKDQRKNDSATQHHIAHNIGEAFANLEREQIPFFDECISRILFKLKLLKVGPILTSFFQVMSILKSSTFERLWKYRVPLYLVVGQSQSGKTSLLNGLSFMRLSGEESINDEIWHLFDNSMFFEVPSNVFFEKEGTFWRFLLTVFLYFRPRRPIDGMILTIPADVLCEQKDASSISQYANETVFKLSTLQNVFNFRVPIYMLITKSDKINGFSDFCSELSPSEKRQIIGWSSSEPIDSGIQKNWLENAITEISCGLRKSALLFAKTKKVSPTLKNAIFIENGIHSILDRLNDYVSILMKQTDKSFFLCLRGIYFVATNKEVLDDAPKLHGAVLNISNIENKSTLYTDIKIHHGMCFADDLFQEKIFREANIAHPINLSTLHVDRNTWIKRCIAVMCSAVWTVGWHRASNEINKEIKSAEKILNTSANIIRKINIIEDDIRDQTDQQILKQETRKILQLVSHIDNEKFFSVFVPASWVSNIKSKISSVIGVLFDSSATKTVFLDLNLNAKLAGSESVAPIREKQNNPFDVSSLESFNTFTDFVAKVARLERMEAEYNRIRRLDDPETINAITKEIFQETFDVSEILNNRPQSSRYTAPQFHLDQFTNQLRNTADKLFTAFLDDVFNKTIEKVFDKLCENIEHVLYASQRQGEPYSYEELKRLNEKLNTLDRLVNSEHFLWLKAKNFSPTSDYDKVLLSVETSRTFGHSMYAKLHGMAQQRFSNFKNKLHTYATAFTDRIFENDSLNLSSGFYQFKKEIGLISSESFIKQEFQKDFSSTIAADQVLIWDIRTILEASNIITKFNSFVDNKLKITREEFQDIYEEIIRKIIYPGIISVLARAQNYEDIASNGNVQYTESITRKQSINLKEIGKYASKIAIFFDDYTSHGGRDCGFAELLIEQASSILNVVDALFSVYSPYSIGDSTFTNWDGNSGPNFGSGANSSDIKQYLSAQYQRMKFLAKELAAPALEILRAPGIENKVSVFGKLSKWEDILQQVLAFENQMPGNSIAALEEFMSRLSRNASIKTLQNDSEINDISNQAGDYFINQRAKIAKAIMSRATDINFQKAYDAYSSISSYFNEQLSGHFPFGTTATDATIASIKNFIDLYDSIDVNIVSAFKHDAGKHDIDGAVFEFLSSLPELIEFLRVWLAHCNDNDPANALVSFKINTRANIDGEVYGHSISEREVYINGVTQDTENEIIIRNGDEVAIEIPFVINNDEIEIEPSKLPNMTVLGSNVTFTYSGEWGIWNMINNHRTAVNSSAGNGTLLEFSIPVTEQSSGAEKAAKVYMNIKMNVKSASGNWKLHKIPNFPEKAPVLQPINF